MKVYYLSTCSTCKKIMLDLPMEQFEKQDIKTEPLQKDQLVAMKNLAGSYQALFSRKAMKYRSMNLHQKELNESDYRDLILSEYTFLKRPVFLIKDKIFMGSSKSTVQALKVALASI